MMPARAGLYARFDCGPLRPVEGWNDFGYALVLDDPVLDARGLRPAVWCAGYIELVDLATDVPRFGAAVLATMRDRLTHLDGDTYQVVMMTLAAALNSAAAVGEVIGDPRRLAPPLEIS